MLQHFFNHLQKFCLSIKSSTSKTLQAQQHHNTCISDNRHATELLTHAFRTTDMQQSCWWSVEPLKAGVL